MCSSVELIHPFSTAHHARPSLHVQIETDEERGRRIAGQWIKPPADAPQGEEVGGQPAYMGACCEDLAGQLAERTSALCQPYGLPVLAPCLHESSY